MIGFDGSATTVEVTVSTVGERGGAGAERSFENTWLAEAGTYYGNGRRRMRETADTELIDR